MSTFAWKNEHPLHGGQSCEQILTHALDARLLTTRTPPLSPLLPPIPSTLCKLPELTTLHFPQNLSSKIAHTCERIGRSRTPSRRGSSNQPVLRTVQTPPSSLRRQRLGPDLQQISAINSHAHTHNTTQISTRYTQHHSDTQTKQHTAQYVQNKHSPLCCLALHLAEFPTFPRLWIKIWHT